MEERGGSIPPIASLQTGVAVFMGSARKGACYRAYEIRSFLEFEFRFGGLKTDLELGYAVLQFFANGGLIAWVVRVARNPTLAQWQRGLAALDKVDVFDLFVLPGVENTEMRVLALNYAETRRAFLILDAPKAATSVALLRAAMPLFSPSVNAAIYFPWIQIGDPANANTPRLTAPSGSVAGVIARTDMMRGVWHAPAGTEATITSATGLAVSINDQEAGELTGLGVNCLREFPSQGRIVSGARTCAGTNDNASEWKYVPVRRLALMLEHSLERGLKWTAFEQSDEPLWAQIRLSVGNFLQEFFRGGAFKGTTPSQAYFVKCDASTMTASDISAGTINILVGFAPLRAGEFLVLKVKLQALAG